MFKGGEAVVRQGERVSREQQLKLSAIWQTDSGTFNPARFGGTLLVR